MALFKDTERRKLNKGKSQDKASLRAVNNYISREDKIGEIENNHIEELIELPKDDIMEYITQNKKTKDRLITGINCSPSSAFDEMMAIKHLHKKTGGRQFKHFVHSYSKIEEITPEVAHEITLKLLEDEKFKDFQILVATHTDTDHIHTHIVVNSVNMETGLKWQHSFGDMVNLTEKSNKLCEEYNLTHSFIDMKTKTFINKENYNIADKNNKKRGRSWKHETWLIINEAIKRSTSKEEFITNMESAGYKVRWVDSRKNITFTLPNGRKLNNDKLHPPERFTKEALLEKFENNKQWENKIEKQTMEELLLSTVKLIEDNPHLGGNKNFPLTYLEGQALKDKMIEEGKGRGLDFEGENEFAREI